MFVFKGVLTDQEKEKLTGNNYKIALENLVRKITRLFEILFNEIINHRVKTMEIPRKSIDMISSGHLNKLV
jgi:hypothetical protein